MGFLVIHYIQNLKKKIEYSLVYKYIQYQIFSKKNIQQPRKWLRNEQVHPMISNFIKNFFFSSRENAKTKRKRSRQVGEFMFNKKRACYIYGTKLWIKRPLSEATSIFLGANTDESVTLPTANLIKLFFGLSLSKMPHFQIEISIVFKLWRVFFYCFQYQLISKKGLHHEGA